MSSTAPHNEEIFSQLFFANKGEHEFQVSSDAHETLTGEPEEINLELAQRQLELEISAFVAKLPMKSRIIRRFQRFGDDTEEMNQEEAAASFTKAFLTARADYKSKGSDTDIPFSEQLVERANAEVGEAYSGDAVMEWFLVNDIEGQVAQLVEGISRHYGVQIDQEHVLETATEACDTAVESFLQGHDKSTGLDVIGQKAALEFIITPNRELSSEFLTSSEGVSIPNFDELGVSGISPGPAIQELMSMTGVTPQMIIGELREEMDQETLLEWSAYSKEVTPPIDGAKMDIQDFLDLLELAGDSGGHPVYVTELPAHAFKNLEPGERVRLEQVGLAVLSDAGEVMGMRVLEAPLELEYSPDTMLPSRAIGADILLNASLKAGELKSSLTKAGLDIKEEQESEPESDMALN